MKAMLSKARTVSIAKKVVPAGFYVLLILFVVLYLRGIDFSKLQGAHFVWGYVGIAVFLELVFRYWGAFIWFQILHGLGARNLTDKARLIYVYAKAWLGRYIPGTAPWILGKIYFASRHGVSKHKLAVSSLLEGGLQIVAVMVVAFFLLMFDPRLDVLSTGYKLLMLGVIVAGVVAMIPAVFNRIVSIAYKLLRHQTLASEHLADSKTIIRGGLLYAVGALINGVSLFFIAKAVYPDLSYHNMFFVMGVGNLSGAVSMLVIFAPSGLGVREGIQLALLSLIMPKEFALLITVVTRLWSIATDFMFLGLSRLTIRPRKASGS